MLPQGLYYRRVGPGDVAGLLAEHGAGRVDLDRCRGRSAYSFPVQAAEQRLREAEGLLGIGDLDLVGCMRTGDETCSVRFRTPDGANHELDVVATLADEPVYLTCDSSEPKRARRHAVTARRVI